MCAFARLAHQISQIPIVLSYFTKHDIWLAGWLAEGVWSWQCFWGGSLFFDIFKKSLKFWYLKHDPRKVDFLKESQAPGRQPWEHTEGV